VSQPGMIYNSTSNTQQTPNYSQRFWYNLSYDLCGIHRSDFSVSEERRLASECQSVPNIGHCVSCILSLLCDVFSLSIFLFFRYNNCHVCEYEIMKHILFDSKHYHAMLYIYVSDRCFSNHASFFFIYLNNFLYHVCDFLFMSWGNTGYWLECLKHPPLFYFELPCVWNEWSNTALWHVSDKHNHGIKVEL
jgi:hypothetical protein